MDSNYTTHWDPSDDYSREGLIEETYTLTEKITAYQDGELVWGTEPEGGTDSGLYGDINIDSKVNVADAVLLQQYLCRKTELKKNQYMRADLNTDGYVNTFDLILLRRLILNYNL